MVSGVGRDPEILKRQKVHAVHMLISSLFIHLFEKYQKIPVIDKRMLCFNDFCKPFKTWQIFFVNFKCVFSDSSFEHFSIKIIVRVLKTDSLRSAGHRLSNENNEKHETNRSQHS